MTDDPLDRPRCDPVIDVETAIRNLELAEEAERALEAEIRNLEPPDPDEPIMKNPWTNSAGAVAILSALSAVFAALAGSMRWEVAIPIILTGVAAASNAIGLFGAKDEKAKLA